MTGEAIADDMHNYWDASHYRATVGDEVLRCTVSGQAVCDHGFGVKVSAADVEQHQAKLQQAFDRWRAAGPSAVRFVAERLKD